MPSGRTDRYGIWKACERLGVFPPDVKSSWEANDVMTKAAILAYSGIRDYEEMDILVKTRGLG